MTEEFDYVVIGAGSAGCVLGARLSDDPDNRVLVLEAGGRDWMPLYRVPMYAGILFRLKYNNWAYTTDPEPHLDGRRIYWPRGKVVGGCSQINGMIYTRGHRMDYDTWRQLGNNGWSYEDVLPYFKLAEDYRDEPAPHHGTGGPLTVEPGRGENVLFDALIEAGAQAGYPVTRDFNEPEREGFGRYHFTINDGRRWSAADAYLKPAMDRPNLTVRTRCHTARIVVENGVAVGVDYLQRGRRRRVYAAREIVLSAGAINSPMLLMHSGIGPADHLREVGIEPVHALPGVGENLHDHLVARMQYACNGPVGLYDDLRIDRVARNTLKALMVGRGPASWFGLSAGCFIRTRPEIDVPDIQLNFVPVMRPVVHLPLQKQTWEHRHGFYAGVQQTQPESRGSLRLRSDDIRAAPRLCANYLATDGDRRTMRAGVKAIRDVLRQPAMARHIDVELQPGDAATDDAAIDAWIRRAGDTVFHPVGTCKMGIDDMAVVDPELRVRGIGALRVADASVMPIINGSNTNAPTMMIAEKAAAMILRRTAA